MVSVSTYRAGLPADDSCRLFAGDHPFIKHKSFIDYRNARIVEAEKLIKGEQQGIFRRWMPSDLRSLRAFATGLSDHRSRRLNTWILIGMRPAINS